MRCERLLSAALVLAAACASPEPREGWAALHDGSLHFESCGRGPAVVLVHGGGLDLRQWDDEVQWLQSAHRVLRYDQRGYGSSPAPLAPCAPKEDLRELLDREGLECALIVGHSNGGRIALDFALSYPERCAGLFLLAPGLSGWSADPAELDAWLQPILAAVEQGDRERVLALWLASPCFAAAREDAAVAAELERLARDNVEAWFRSAAELELDPPAAARLSELAAPARVLIGRRDAPELLRIAEAIGVHAPQAELVWIDGAGHALDLERPQVVRAELEAFLRELDCLRELGW